MKIEADAGYIVRIGEPVCIAEVKASSTSVAVPCEAIPDGEYLVSLEVNGTVVAHRDTFSFASGSCTVGDYTLAYSSYAVTVSTTSNNDVVRLVIEPLKVVATDAFKAAVKKVAPEAPNELPAITDADDGKVLTANSGVWVAANPSGGGDIEVVRFTIVGENNVTCDHTFAELQSARTSGKDLIAIITYNGMERISTLVYYVDDEYEGYDTGYSNFAAALLSNGKGFVQNEWFCSVTSDGVSGGASTSNIVTLLTTTETSKQLSATFTDIEGAINSGASVQIKSYNKVVGTAVATEAKPLNNQYNVYGSIIVNGALTSVVWTASSSSGEPARS